MFRVLLFLLGVIVAVAVLAWLADHPGRLAIDWQGYRIETSVAVLVILVALVAALAAAGYRAWLALRRAPRQVSQAWHGKRRRQGYQALTRGMVAVAAGDPDEASRQVKRAEVLLKDPPLTMLLSAQAAQLNGDDTAAETFFRAMTEEPETEFLGLRGLMAQAIKRGDSEGALKLARRAYRLRPKSEWVAKSLFDLHARTGRWLDARVTTDDLVRNRILTKDESRRYKAVLAFQIGLTARESGDMTEAVKKLKQAVDLDSQFVPAVALLTTLSVGQNRTRKAAAMIEKAWAANPHPELVSPYWDAMKAGTALDRVKATQKLAKSNPDHRESHMAVVRAMLDAQLWGEARAHLETLTGDGSDDLEARVCRMWAELEEAEHNDIAKAHAWLTRASLASSDPAWVCATCGNTVPDWSAICGNCGSFDSFSWRTPPHVTHLENPRGRAEVPALPAAD